MSQYAQRATNGGHYVWLQVTVAEGAQGLANLLWDGMTREERDSWSPDVVMPVRKVRAAVERSIRYRGTGWQGIEDDEVWVNGGGFDWALATVRRVYRFPEEAAGA